MKSFAVFALAIVICAGEYTYKAPKLPCAFEMKLSTKANESEPVENAKYVLNDNFVYVEMLSSDFSIRYIYRPDITEKDSSGEDMIGLAMIQQEKCSTEYISKDDVESALEDFRSSALSEWDRKTWSHKENTTYNGKKCVVYYNADINTRALQVYDDYPYVLREDGYETIIDLKWEAPMDTFKLKDCKSDFAKTPSAKYSKCSTTTSSSTDIASSTQAVAGFVLGVIAASLVVLF